MRMHAHASDERSSRAKNTTAPGRPPSPKMRPPFVAQTQSRVLQGGTRRALHSKGSGSSSLPRRAGSALSYYVLRQQLPCMPCSSTSTTPAGVLVALAPTQPVPLPRARPGGHPKLAVRPSAHALHTPRLARWRGWTCAVAALRPPHRAGSAQASAAARRCRAMTAGPTCIRRRATRVSDVCLALTLGARQSGEHVRWT